MYLPRRSSENPIRDPSPYDRRGGGGGTKYFKLREDATGNGAFWAQKSDRNGSDLGGHVQVYNWEDLITGAQAGYLAQYSRVSGTWDFTQGPCITLCATDGTLTAGSPPAGTVDSPYTHTVTGTNLDTGITVTGLPPGLSATGGAISGTPTTAGTYYLTATATADSCTLTRVFVIVIAEA